MKKIYFLIIALVLLKVPASLLATRQNLNSKTDYISHDTQGNQESVIASSAISSETQSSRPPTSSPKTPRVVSPDKKEAGTSAASAAPLRSTFLAILEKLPKIEDGKMLSDTEAHQLPPEFLAKLEPLVRINHIIKENPKLEPAALEFYESCASQNDLMNAVRARCLTHLRNLAKKRGETVDLSHYSARLIRLSDFINL